ncbi:Uncharacterised protein [Vibrio cholerae]|nr:Uncharacterised protein [Vibrio cholerae]
MVTQAQNGSLLMDCFALNLILLKVIQIESCLP